MMKSRRNQRILAIDVGGTHVKVAVNDGKQPREVASGPEMTARKMVSDVKRMTRGWDYSAISIGFPGPVVHNRPLQEPFNLGGGWVAFDFSRAFRRPVKIINDAAMQALGSYEGGRMLFLGLGTGLGSAMIVDGVVEPMELAHLPYKKGKTYEDYAGLRSLQRFGKKKWRRHVLDIIERLEAALEPDYVVLGGGNAKKMKRLPDGIRLGDNRNAFSGGFRMWEKSPALRGRGGAETKMISSPLR